MDGFRSEREDGTETETRTRTSTGRSAIAVVTLLLVASLAGLAAGTAAIGVGTVTAGDQYATITPTPYAVEADPGDEFTVDILLYTEGGHGGEGVSDVDLVAQYHPDLLEITDVERGPWLEQGDETDVEAERTLAHEEGTAILEQRRDPVGDGATGHAELATVTAEVAADAPAAETDISFGETTIELIRDWPLPIDEQDISVTIGGGGAGSDDTDGDGGDEQGAIEPFDHPDLADIDRDSSASAQNDSDGDGSGGSETGPDGETGDETGSASVDDGTDSVPGFTGILSGLLLAGGSLALARLHGNPTERRE